MVLMLVKNLPARALEAYVAENVVARVFLGRQADPQPQIRDHSNIARAYAALGKDGIEDVNALMLHVAKDYGFVDASILSSDTTAQELPMGYPNEPGAYAGGRSAVAAPDEAQNPRGGGDRDGPRPGADDPQDGQRTPLCQGRSRPSARC